MKRWRIAPWTIVPVLVGAALVIGVVPVMAQDKPVSFNIGVGPVFPNGKISEKFDTGVTVPVGVTFNVTEKVGIGVEYVFGRMSGPSALINDAIRGGAQKIQIDSKHSMHDVTFNLVYKTPRSGSVGGYVLGGPGVYHRQVELTTPGTGFVEVCDPYWYVCTPALMPVPVEQVVGSRSTTDFGFNVGGGVTFGHFYVEVRYHFARGPVLPVPTQLAAGATETVRANGHYIPINFGVRW